MAALSLLYDSLVGRALVCRVAESLLTTSCAVAAARFLRFFGSGVNLTSYARIHFLACIVHCLHLAQPLSPTEEVFCPQSTDIALRHSFTAPQRAVCLLSPDILPHWPHGRISTRLLDVRTAHASRDAD